MGGPSPMSPQRQTPETSRSIFLAAAMVGATVLIAGFVLARALDRATRGDDGEAGVGPAGRARRHGRAREPAGARCGRSARTGPESPLHAEPRRVAWTRSGAGARHDRRVIRLLQCPFCARVGPTLQQICNAPESGEHSDYKRGFWSDNGFYDNSGCSTKIEMSAFSSRPRYPRGHGDSEHELRGAGSRARDRAGDCEAADAA